MNKIIFAVIISIAAAFAQTLAVLEITTPEEEENDEVKLAVKEIRLLTDELRRQAAITLPDFSIFTRGQIIDFASENEDLENATVLEIGKAIKSDFVASGSISKVGSLLTLKAELFETESGQLLADFTGESQDLKGLMDVVRSNAPKMFKKLAKEEELEKPEAVKVNVEVQVVPTNIEAKPRTSTWVAVGFDVLGAAGLGIGIYQHSKASDHYSEYKKMPNNLSKEEFELRKGEYDSAYKKVENARTARNISFAMGGVLLLSGVVVHVWF